MKSKRLFLRRGVLSWALYDWANSAFATTVIAGFFPVFYSALSADLSARDSQFWFQITLAASSIAVAIAAPLLGAIADRGGGRKKFLAVFAMTGILMTAGLAWVHAGMWQVGLLLYALGSVGFSGANIFYDAMLVEVSEPHEFDLVSSYGFALGYIGGGLLFAVNVLMVTQPAWFGFADAGGAVSASFISVAIWWGAFTVPLLLIPADKDESAAPRMRALPAVRAGLKELLATFRQLRRMKTLFLFLAAYWFYIDGVGTIIKMAVFFGNRILSLPPESLIVALLLTQFIAFPSALFFGWFGGRIGPRRAILAGLAVYLAVIAYAWRWLNSAADFYLLAAAIGLVQGGVQSLSRSLYARFVPKAKSAEFFGFFNMIGKFAAILGPLLMAAVPFVVRGAGERDSILALALLFVIGGALLWKVDVADGERAAREMSR
ncbi:MAG: MFS transporter [Gammaproteobacteria bacterium]|nr:MFS transporter [Gammaproteobacteria bacterium]MDA7961421.1 MFS transporter [Gammaproteobacteria bacterium]MDA7972355.1 MFS transporter [Gammaproteobacteria bacterium]MDA8024544.1 MFS transporter [Gammaproteobacteria bacterium]CAJ2376854.1 MAG: MFS transporter [Arenicellales bacterium IbO2]